MKLINLNYIAKQFSEEYYSDNKENIINDILDISKEISDTNNIDSYNTIKLLKAIISYCVIKNIDLNKFFKLHV